MMTKRASKLKIVLKYHVLLYWRGGVVPGGGDLGEPGNPLDPPMEIVYVSPNAYIHQENVLRPINLLTNINTSVYDTVIKMALKISILHPVPC